MMIKVFYLQIIKKYYYNYEKVINNILREMSKYPFFKNYWIERYKKKIPIKNSNEKLRL